jgi:hypothetical protein
MSKSEVPVQKSHVTGTWRAIRSMAVPANVTSVHSSQAPSAHLSGLSPVKDMEKDPVFLKERKAPAYFEAADPSFSKS